MANEKEIKEITNGIHSLFVIPQKEEFVKINIPGQYKKIKSSNLYRLFIQSFSTYSLEDKEQHKLNKIFNELLESNNEDNKLNIHISSNGGYIHELMRFENLINLNFKGRTLTILDNHGYSCGALLFLMGNDRFVYKDSMVMFHYYSGGAYGKGGEIKDQAEFQNKYYENYFKKAMKPYFSKKEIAELLIGKDYWLNSEEMIERGIATKII